MSASPLPDAGLDLRDVREVGEVHAVEAHRAVDQVDVRVVEAGKDEATAEVDDLGLGPAQALDLARGSDRHDPAAADGHGLGPGGVGLGRPDPAAQQEDVRRFLGGQGTREGNEERAQETAAT